MLRVDELDLAFLSVTERIESQGLELRPLVTEELVAVLPTEHPLAPRRRVRMAELADFPFISFREGARLRELLIGAAHDAGFEPRIALESNESRRIHKLVARGLGVAVLPRSDATGGGVAVATLVEPKLARDITLAWRARRRHSPAAAAFLELTQRTYGGGEATRPTAAATA